MRLRRDWAAYKARFVACDLSVKEFAEREGLKSHSVMSRCRLDGWLAAREAFRQRVADKSMAALEMNRVRAEMQIDGEAHELSGHIMSQVRRLLMGQPSAKELHQLGQALDISYRLQRETAGLPVEKQSLPHNRMAHRERQAQLLSRAIDEARKALAQRKLEAAAQTVEVVAIADPPPDDATR